jgi:3-methylcrotonyl-CoA carboxylase alpha subunit
VEWQLRVAAGEPLPVRQGEISLSGHAIEARIYAEDPARDFAPSIGRLALFRTPAEAPGVRIDTGFATGDAVSVHYDAMLAKLICHGPSRDAALRVFRRALADCEVVGVASNLDMLARIAAHPAFAAGGIDTGFIAREADVLLVGPGLPPDEVLAAAALAELLSEADDAARDAAGNADPHSPWAERDLWWVNEAPVRVLEFVAGEVVCPVSVSRAGQAWRLVTGGGELTGSAARRPDGMLDVVLDGVVEHVSVVRDGEVRAVRRRGAGWRLRLPDPIAGADEEESGGDRLIAPIPGQVTQVIAEAGQAVTRGQILVVLEAMKTVFRLPAPADGTVASVACAAGEMVQEGQVLVSFVTPDPD